MKLYEWSDAPNCRRVAIYLREKGLDVERVHVDIVKGEHMTPEFRAKNPSGQIPVLELDDGSFLSESLAIVEYLEELHPDPPMIGSTPEERARVRSLERRADLGILENAVMVFRNTSPFFATRVTQSESTVAYATAAYKKAIRGLDELIGEGPFVAGGASPTIADCTLVASIEFAMFAGLELDPNLANIVRWWTAFSQRPSVV